MDGQGQTVYSTDLLDLDYTYGTTANNGNVLNQTITVQSVGTTPPGFTAVQNYSYDSLFMRDMKKRACILALLFITSASCDAGGDKQRFGPNEKTSLIVIFKNGTSYDAINEFDQKVISVPHESGRGIWSLPGIKSGYMFSRAGCEGKGINFTDDATDEQRRFIIERVHASSVVYRTYEGVSPNELPDIECGH